MEQSTSKPSRVTGTINPRTSRQKLVSGLALLKLSAKIILAIGYIYFEIWLWGLIRQFYSQRQTVDLFYAIIAFAFFPITALYNGLGWYVWAVFCSWRREVVSESEAERDMFNVNTRLINLRCTFVSAIHLSLISRLSLWSQNFQADGKAKDAKICTYLVVFIAFEVLLVIMDLGNALHDYVSHVKASGGASCKATFLKSDEQESER
ncbi:hypothetical protein M431DRAFT_485141 [Trichoderma harzianum CBS 226.95]|uniref:Uncharacterized protein n=1 Tax=Trichoderma harzianum CBS 226.95 TaxID=983964 RepID=A0A2T4A2L5_TRIHA|nr:hypothetical protein M431DRAFT_485141 [Trichoderma harzianum CBS 226.95]PTB51278.1 hypothetical protein M431DRAFT_485141 [Trichoderma harzianum CBS 226.95]